MKNLPDGSVEAEFTGDETDVENLIDYCRNRMPVARVERAEIEKKEFTRHDGFEIRY